MYGQTNPGENCSPLCCESIETGVGYRSSFFHFSQYFSPLQADPSKPVMVPGDPERNHIKMVDQEGGVRYHENQLKESVSLSKHTRL